MKSLAAFAFQCATITALCVTVVVVLWMPVLAFFITWSLK